MKELITKSICFFLFVIVVLSVNKVNAQELSLGADIYNRYIWRGFDLGDNAANIQPSMELSVGNFRVGFWGSYTMSDPAGLNEVDLYAKYDFDLSESGVLSLGVIDYTNPNSGTKMGNFNNWDEGYGAHFVELNVDYAGPESLPIYLSFNWFLYNVENNPIYFELGYKTSLKDVDLTFFAGGTPGEDTGYYGITKFGFVNVGFKAEKEIKITDSFGFSTSGSIIVNPAAEDLFYVVGISL